jgi:hypothetical protein
MVKKPKPDVLGGLKAAAAPHPRHPSCAIIVFAYEMNDKTPLTAICCGAAGFLPRNPMFRDLHKAPRNVYAGKGRMFRTIAARIFNLFAVWSAPPPYPSFWGKKGGKTSGTNRIAVCRCGLCLWHNTHADARRCFVAGSFIFTGVKPAERKRGSPHG